MKRLLSLSAILSIGLLAGCSGGSNSSAGNGGQPPPPVTPPVTPPADTRFETFVMNILAQTNETASPFAVNDVGLTFDEAPGVFASVTGN